MILVLFILVPLVGGAIAWLLDRAQPGTARWAALIAMAVELLLALGLWISVLGGGQPQPWYVDLRAPWIPALGISFHLAVDGLSLVLVALTAFLGLVAVAIAWREIRERTGFFYMNLMWLLAGITGVFLALDLFLFLFFWELMLVPTYLLYFWGAPDEESSARRVRAGLKFFVYTQVSGLLMLIAAIGLALAHQQATGTLTFDYQQLIHTPIGGTLGLLLMLGFFFAFAVKLPLFPFHTWQPDAYVEAPTAVTVVLAGAMAKTAGYGMIRFLVPLFPAAAAEFTPYALALGVIGVLYGAVLAYSQHDLKRLIAYSSISHMSLVVIGVFAWNQIALLGVTMQLVAHGIATGALFALAGMLEQRTGTRDIRVLGGLWSRQSALGATFLLFALAALGLPGLGNFVAEFLTLAGTFARSPAAAAIAALGVITSAIYALWMIQRVFQGTPVTEAKMPAFSGREAVVLVALVIVIVWLGLFPGAVLDRASEGVGNALGSSGAASAQVLSANTTPGRSYVGQATTLGAERGTL